MVVGCVQIWGRENLAQMELDVFEEQKVGLENSEQERKWWKMRSENQAMAILHRDWQAVLSLSFLVRNLFGGLLAGE